MGGLRATRSLTVIAPQALEHSCKFPSEEPEVQDAAVAIQRIRLDCGICSISLEQGGQRLPHLGHLVITFAEVRMHRSSQIRRVVDSLARVLEEILRTGIDFVTTYDFRSSCVSMPRLARALGQFHTKNSAHFSQRLKAIALLMPDNLFAVAAKGVAGRFIRECCLPSCPRVICHGEAIAEEFFKVVTKDPSSSDSSFMSVAEVREIVGNLWTFDSEKCVAKLLPYSHRQSADSVVEGAAGMAQVHSAPLMHTLANGDVRVIQSPASDVMLRGQEVGPAINVQDNVSKPLNAEFKPTRMSTFDLQVEALKFRCSVQTLSELIGTHLHIGELTIDADAASTVLKGPLRSCKIEVAPQNHPQKSASRGQKDASLEKISVVVSSWTHTGCFGGLAALLPWTVPLGLLPKMSSLEGA